MLLRTAFAILVLQVSLSAQSAAPIPPIAAGRLFEALDDLDLAALEGQDLDHLHRLMKKGRIREPAAFSGAAVVPFEDGFGRTTRVYLRVPKKPRALLVLLHGLGGNERQLAGAVSEDLLEREGIIVLAPCAQPLPPDHPNSDVGLLDKLQPHWWSYDERGIVMSAILSVARLYEFDRDRVYLSGHSMGGFGAWNLGLRFADRLAAAAPMSGGISRREYVGSKPHRRYHLLLDNAVHLPLFFAHGDQDGLVPVEFERRLHAGLLEREIPHTYVELKGAGHLIDLGDRGPVMPKLSEFILKAKRDPHPRRIVHRVIEDRPSRSFWIRIDSIWASTGKIEAQVDEENGIELRCSGVDRFTVFLDEALIDLERPVRLRVNGKLLHEGKVEPDLETLLESWREREDPAFVHRAALRFKAP